MTRIVVTHYRYKRPPKRQKPVAIAVTAMVVARRKAPAAPEPSPGDNRGTATTKPIVVVSVSRKRARQLRWAAEGPIQPSPEVAEFFVRNVRSGGPRSPSKP